MKFALASENSNTLWAFEIDMTHGEFMEWANNQDYPIPYEGRILIGNRYLDFISEQESNGVLDIGGGTELELFHSYEIAEKSFPAILKKFREFFIKNGLKVNEAIEVGTWK